MAISRICGIVIGLVRHNDKNNVVTLFTRERGRIALLSPPGGGSKSSRMRNARLMTLSVIEADVDFKGSRTLQKLGQFTPHTVWHTIYFDPVKSAVAMFVAEFLNRYLQDAAPDEALWNFVYASIRLLDSMDQGVANFHIWFLVRFLEPAGISPDLSNYQNGDRFSMRQGVLVPAESYEKDALDSSQTAFLRKLMRISSVNMHRFRFSGVQRREVLGQLLKYYAHHYPGMMNMKSLDILAEVFS